MSAPFKYKAKNLWQWLKYRKQIKHLNKLAEYWWKREGEHRFRDIISKYNYAVGRGYIKLVWNESKEI